MKAKPKSVCDGRLGARSADDRSATTLKSNQVQEGARPSAVPGLATMPFAQTDEDSLKKTLNKIYRLCQQDTLRNRDKIAGIKIAILETNQCGKVL